MHFLPFTDVYKKKWRINGSAQQTSSDVHFMENIIAPRATSFRLCGGWGGRPDAWCKKTGGLMEKAAVIKASLLKTDATTQGLLLQRGRQSPETHSSSSPGHVFSPPYRYIFVSIWSPIRSTAARKNKQKKPPTPMLIRAALKLTCTLSKWNDLPRCLNVIWCWVKKLILKRVFQRPLALWIRDPQYEHTVFGRDKNRHFGVASAVVFSLLHVESVWRESCARMKGVSIPQPSACFHVNSRCSPW